MMASRRSNIVISGPATNAKETNVKVVIRVRPENQHEAESGSRNIIGVLDNHVLIFDPQEQSSPQFFHGRKMRGRNMLKRKNKDLRFAFDRVFGGEAAQQEVYESTTKPVIEGLMSGYNCSVFAYGATGAGKTFTMLGGHNCPGVIFLTMMDLYSRIAQVQAEKQCDVAVSYLEVYNEKIRDLLVPSGSLAVREDPQKGVCVNGLSVHKPQCAEELIHMLECGNKNRTQHPTDANSESSRSHAVFQVFVRQKNRTANLSTDVKIGKMSLIDLAGSERASATNNRGARFQEGANINRSLLALGSCINALANNKVDQYVPYRNSKLTRLLKDSLGGNCRTVMIAAVSPSSLTYEDTYNTLRYADRAKNIKSQVKKNVVNINFHVSQYTKIIADLRLEVTELKNKLSQHPVLPSNSCSISKHDGESTTSEPNREVIISYLSVLYNVFTERASVRKELMELESSDRDLTLKISRKHLTMERIRIVYGCEAQGEKTMAKYQRTIAASESRHTRIRKRKIDVNCRMEENEESLKSIRTEMSAIGNKGEIPEVLQSTLRTRHLEIEVKDLRRQVKHLKKFARKQDGYLQSSEKLISTLLSTVRKQYYVLKGSDMATSDTVTEFENIQRLVEGDREVLWADQSMIEHESSPDVNSLLDLPVLSCVRTTPNAPVSTAGTYAQVAADATNPSTSTPHRPNVAHLNSSNHHTTPSQPPRTVIIGGTATMATHIMRTATPKQQTHLHSQVSQPRTLSGHRTLSSGTPLRQHHPPIINSDCKSAASRNFHSKLQSCSRVIKTNNNEPEKPSSAFRGLLMDSVQTPLKVCDNSSFSVEDGVFLLKPSPAPPTSQQSLVSVQHAQDDCNEQNDQTYCLNLESGGAPNIPKSPCVSTQGQLITVQPMTYAEVTSVPKPVNDCARRPPLTEVPVNSPRINKVVFQHRRQQRTKNSHRMFNANKHGAGSSTAAAVRSLGLPSVSDHIKAKKRPAPAYMTLTTAAANKRRNTKHDRSSSVEVKENSANHLGRAVRVKTNSKGPSRNLALTRTKSMSSLRSNWQS